MGGITFLPFVRDSRNAPVVPQNVSNKKPPAEKKAEVAKPAAVAASTPAPAPVTAAPAIATPAPVSGPEGDLINAITAIGEEVRQLKTAKVFYTLTLSLFYSKLL